MFQSVSHDHDNEEKKDNDEQAPTKWRRRRGVVASLTSRKTTTKTTTTTPTASSWCRPLRLVQAVGAFIMLIISTINVRVSSRAVAGTTSSSSSSSNSFLTTTGHWQAWESSNNDKTNTTNDYSKNKGFTVDHTEIFKPAAPWRTSTIMPRWMKEYFAWHAQQRAALTADNWNNGTFTFFIVRCIHDDTKCGGTADRLKPLPFYMLVAHAMKRILLFWWEKPAPLELFLQPPAVDGLDWRLPEYIIQAAGQTRQLRSSVPHMHGGAPLQRVLGYKEPDEEHPMGHLGKPAKRTSQILITTKFQSHGHGAYEYNHLRKQYSYFHQKYNRTLQPLNVATHEDEVEPTYEQVFRHVWYSTFVPVPAIQQRMATEMTNLGLRRNAFQAIHIRSRYANTMGPAKLRNLCANAVHCIFQANPVLAATKPIYVSADHESALWTVLHYSHHDLGLTHVTARNAPYWLSLPNETAFAAAQQAANTPLLHLDRGTNHLARKPAEWTAHQFQAEDYYDTFVDLYILS